MPITLFDEDKNILEATFLQFSGGERHVQLGGFGRIKKFFIRADLRNSNDILDLLLVADALNERTDTPELYIEVPYLPYARQDRVCAEGQAFSLNVLAKMFGLIQNVKKWVIWDCHSSVGVKLTGARNIPAQDIIKNSHELSRLIVDLNTVIVCPDKGAVERTNAIVTAFEKDLQPAPIVYCEKVRDPVTGQITHTNVKTDSLEGRVAIITDDICDGGYTFIKVAEQLRAKGAKQIILFVTHGIFSKGLGVFENLIDHIFTTDSFIHDADSHLTVIPFQTDFHK